MKAKQQLVGESAAQYALSKATLRQYYPHQMNEAEFVPYLINGIRHHQFAPVLVHSQLANVQAFIETYSRLEAAVIHTPEIPDKHGKTIESLVAQNSTLATQILDLQRKWLPNSKQHSITSPRLCAKSIGKISGDRLELWTTGNATTVTSTVT